MAALPLCASPPADKGAVGPQAEATRLLEWGDRYSPAALTKARAYYRGLGAKSKEDAGVQYAFALVLIRQHSHQEAVELLDEIIAREPGALHVWRAKIWAEMALHKDHEALADVRAVADVLAEQSPATLPAADLDEWRATAAFLGQVFGFLEVPRPAALPADELRSAKQHVLADLGDERTEFEQSEEAVAEKFSQVHRTFEDVRAKRVAAGKIRQEQYGQKKKANDETQTNVDFDTEKVKNNTTAEVDRLDRMAESLQKWLAASQYRLNVVRVAIVNNEEKLYQQALAGEAPPPGFTFRPGAVVAQARRFSEIKALVQRLAVEQVMLTQQIKQLSEQLQDTVAQRDALLDMGLNTTAGLKAQAAQLKREERRLVRAEQAEAKKITVQRQKTLLTKQTAFATFAPFPFDTEKQRVLGTADP